MKRKVIEFLQEGKEIGHSVASTTAEIILAVLRGIAEVILVVLRGILDGDIISNAISAAIFSLTVWVMRRFVLPPPRQRPTTRDNGRATVSIPSATETTQQGPFVWETTTTQGGVAELTTTQGGVFETTTEPVTASTSVETATTSPVTPPPVGKSPFLSDFWVYLVIFLSAFVLIRVLRGYWK
ncbi:hypothetical protein [Halopelagius inordinatus]|uniref:hypothetical protein n=1 Tax=Halopelagius inordinatus TaxID=553467 RepID=UPI001160DAD6|nr:hypothetical protein [Halopelagius inordinatus]